MGTYTIDYTDDLGRLHRFVGVSTFAAGDDGRFQVASTTFDNTNLPTSLSILQARNYEAPCKLPFMPRMIEIEVSGTPYRFPVPFVLGSPAMVAVHAELDTAGTAYTQIGESPGDTYLYSQL